MKDRKGTSEFGRLLRQWRTERGMSQLELAARAATTPRHVSFLETGRSRPGSELVLRLAGELEVPRRQQNALLAAAGLPAAFQDRGLDDAELYRFRDAIDALLKSHEPLPAAVVDRYGAVRRANRAFERLAPGVVGREPEDIVEQFFGQGPWRDAIVNWPDVAASWLARHRQEARRTRDPRLASLVKRAEKLIGKTPPSTTTVTTLPSMLCARLNMGGVELELFAAVVRFDGADDLTLGELRIELLYPKNDATVRFFQR